MEFIDIVNSRASVRAFTGRQLTDGEIQRLLKCAIRAPNACNMQSWHFYVLTSEAAKAQLDGVCSKWVTTAPVVIVVCTQLTSIADRFGTRATDLFYIQDTAAAVENILLCEQKCREALSIPENRRPVAFVPVGEPLMPAVPGERRNVEDVVTFL